jgi:hypothetical protein
MGLVLVAYVAHWGKNETERPGRGLKSRLSCPLIASFLLTTFFHSSGLTFINVACFLYESTSGTRQSYRASQDTIIPSTCGERTVILVATRPHATHENKLYMSRVELSIEPARIPLYTSTWVERTVVLVATRPHVTHENKVYLPKCTVPIKPRIPSVHGARPRAPLLVHSESDGRQRSGYPHVKASKVD